MGPVVEPRRLAFSVVIPTHNRAALLRQALTAVLLQQPWDHEIIVVDDGSSDGTPEMVRREFPVVRLLGQSQAGPAAARNLGIRAAQNQWVAFTDDDCAPPPDWLARLAEGFARHPEVVGVGGRLVAPPELRRSNLLARYEETVARLALGAGSQEALGGFESPAGGTNNIAYRRDALEAVQGFDEAFPYPAGEDADLKMRLARAGGTFLYIPVDVIHLREYTWPAFQRQQWMRGKGRAFFDSRWGRRPTRLTIALRLVRGLARAVASPLGGSEFRRLALEEAWQSALGQWAALSELPR